MASENPPLFPTVSAEDAESTRPRASNGELLNGPKESIAVQSEQKEDNLREPAWPAAREGQDEVVRLLREMRHDLSRLVKISEKASRRNKAHLDYLAGTRFSRRWGLALLIVIAVLMVIQILQMAGYGPGGNGDDNNTQTLQRVHANTQTLQRVHTAG